jgi:phenylacetate-CoA ligase
MPLVRYQTGDYAAVYREKCPCGSRTPRLGPIVGRKHHKLKVKGTKLFPSTFRTVLDTTDGVQSYVLIARRDGAMSDKVEVRLACSGDPARVLPALRERFQGEAKVVPEMAVAPAADIEAMQLPAGARKRRYFVDLRD